MTANLCPIPRVRDDEFPCADLLSVRKAVVEIRDSQKALASRLSDEFARRSKWEQDTGEALVFVGAKVDKIACVLGTAPDPIAGTEGTGITGVIYRMATAPGHRVTLPTLEWDEGEDTSVQTRLEVLARAKHAERLASAEEERRLSLEVQLATVQAQLAERTRQSERVHSDAQARAERKTRIVVALATGGMGLACVGELLRWLLH